MALAIPSMLLKQLHTNGSLKNTENGVEFSVKNRLSDTRITAVTDLKFDAQSVPMASIMVRLDDGTLLAAADIATDPIDFPLRRTMDVVVAGASLSPGIHEIEITFVTEPFGELVINVDDSITENLTQVAQIPRNPADDYSPEAIAARQAFVESYTGTKLQHVPHYSFDPHVLQGNVENFTGVAQIPIGFAGPITIHGEHAQGDFIIPLATTEGTLVASYNRGMKILNLSGGVTCTVIGDAMQRAPVFVFPNAREARTFVAWVEENMDGIREAAEATSSIAKLQYIDYYMAGKFAYLRFNYGTGDAAGQNMVGRATFAACSWILDQYPGVEHFFLESNLATDKKASQVNIMHTRGKRVVAEAIIKKDVLAQHMRVDTENLAYH